MNRKPQVRSRKPYQRRQRDDESSPEKKKTKPRTSKPAPPEKEKTKTTIEVVMEDDDDDDGKGAGEQADDFNDSGVFDYDEDPANFLLESSLSEQVSYGNDVEDPVVDDDDEMTETEMTIGHGHDEEGEPMSNVTDNEIESNFRSIINPEGYHSPHPSNFPPNETTMAEWLKTNNEDVTADLALQLVFDRFNITTSAQDAFLGMIFCLKFDIEKIPTRTYRMRKNIDPLCKIRAKRFVFCNRCKETRDYVSGCRDYCKKCYSHSPKEGIKVAKDNQLLVFSIKDSLQQLLLMNPTLFDDRCDSDGNEIVTGNSLVKGLVYRRLHEQREAMNGEKYKKRATLLLNYDDGRLRKSAQYCISPISFVVAELDLTSRLAAHNVMLAALWVGKEYPNVPLLWARGFWDQFKELRGTPVDFFNASGEIIPISVEALCLVADQPAASKSTCHTSHNGHYGCNQCTIRMHQLDDKVLPNGNRVPGKRVYRYQDKGVKKRNFSVLASCPTHLKFGIISNSVLNRFLTDTPDQIPKDIMHMVYEGIVRKLVTLTVPKQAMDGIDELLCNIAVPFDMVSRKPRSIAKALAVWKASEFKNFLFYFYPVLKEKIKPDHFALFSLLSTTIRLACSKRMEINEEHIAMIRFFADRFYYHYQEIIGEEHCVSNIHAMAHLAEQVENYGSTANTNVYVFENLIYLLMKDAKGTNHYANQIFYAYRRRCGMNHLFRDRNLDSRKGPLVHACQRFMTSGKEKGGILFLNCFCIGDRVLELDAHVANEIKSVYPEYFVGPRHVTVAKRIIVNSFEYHCILYNSSINRVNSSNTGFVEYSDSKNKAQLAEIKFYLLPPDKKDWPVICVAESYVAEKSSGMFKGLMTKISKSLKKDCMRPKSHDNLIDWVDSFFWRVKKDKMRSIIFFEPQFIRFRALKYKIMDNVKNETWIATVIDSEHEGS